jgi:BMFP domain-containing protein YqiC
LRGGVYVRVYNLRYDKIEVIWDGLSTKQRKKLKKCQKEIESSLKEMIKMKLQELALKHLDRMIEEYFENYS